MTDHSSGLIYPSFASNYILLAGSNSPAASEEQNGKLLTQFYSGIPASKADYRYAPGKWRIQQVIRHLIDTERIFCYRLLSIIREEQQILPPFDENGYADKSDSVPVSWDQTLTEWVSSRKATADMLRGISEPDWDKVGQVGEYKISARAIGLLLTGHQLHHREILITRYGC